MRVGTLCFAAEMGIGLLAKDFYDNGIVTDVLTVRHPKHINHAEWYPGSSCVSHMDPSIAERFSACDVVLFFETPFNWALIPELRRRGVRTALVTMYECTQPHRLASPPDLWVCPSLLDLEYFAGERAAAPFHVVRGRYDRPCVFAPVPVDVLWRQRSIVRTFVHNAGHGGLRGRNGTKELYAALQHVRKPIGLIIRQQEQVLPQQDAEIDIGPVNVSIRNGTLTRSQLYEEGDCFVFPEKFNGLSLPLQEARASGMYIIATDRFPVNTWLPKEGLVPPLGYSKERVGTSYFLYDEATIDVKALAARIDAAYGADVSEYSREGLRWAGLHSWKVLGPEWKEMLCALCT